MKRRPKILIIYKCLGFPLRTTIDEHLYSFRRYANARCFYLKLDPRTAESHQKDPVPEYLMNINFDLIIFHYGFISSRWGGKDFYQEAFEQVKALKDHKAIKILLPQDEYMGSESMVHCINELGINMVFSVSPESEWDQLYPGIDRNKVKFHKVLTGYLDDGGLAVIRRFLRFSRKDIDIGYRARNLPQWLGRHAHMKTIIADVFNQKVTKFRIKTDISTNPKDTFFGHSWYKFMCRCKYMIGVEGGATINDPDGSIAIKSRRYLEANPNCTFEEIEAACFPGLDGKLQLIAISPRNLEACATRTCQVLVESTYNGILKPHIHYIPLKKDLSNIEDVLRTIEKDEKRKEITDNAYRDIVASGLYSYRNFAKLVIEKSMELAQGHYFEQPAKRTFIAFLYNRIIDWWWWKRDFFYYRVYKPLPNKWFYLVPMIKLIKFLRLKNTAKFIYLTVSRKKSWP